MSRVKRECRICGKEYEACSALFHKAGQFVWQEVACSPECGAEYLRRIQVSRGLIPDTPPQAEEQQAVEEQAEAEAVVAKPEVDVMDTPKAVRKRSRKADKDTED